MKNLTYLALAAAFIFSAQPQEAFSATDYIETTVSGPEISNTAPRIQFSEDTETLLISIAPTGQYEKVNVQVYNRKSGVVAKEIFKLSPRGGKFIMDLPGLASGSYTVKISSATIRVESGFKKK